MDAVRVLRHQSAAHSDIFKEAPEVVALVQGSGLWPAIFYAQEEFDAVTNSAFCERFCPETYTFHLPFGEMSITPDDAQKISGLRTHGKNVYSAVYEMTWDELYVLAEETLGWPKDKTELEFACAAKEVKFVDSSTKKLKKIKFTALKKCFGDTNEKISKGELVMDEVTAKCTVTAYFLYTLGSVIFPDNSGNKVNAQYLQFLRDLKSWHKYSWGTTALSFLFEQLGTASRLTSRNIGGYFTMLQVWIYDHFPELNLAKEDDKWVDTFYTSSKWSFKENKKRNKKEILIALREKLDSLTAEQVVFQPYKKDEEDDEVVEDEDMALGMYYGPLFYPEGFTVFDPRRVLRQYGFIQTIPVLEESKFKLLPKGSKGTKSTESSWNAEYDPDHTIDCWDKLEDNKLSWVDLEELRDDPCEVDPTYIDWYNQISHPLIINGESQALVDGKRGKRTQKEVEPKTRKNTKIMVENVSKSYRTMVAGGNDVLKTMKKKIDCNVEMAVEEQEYINKGEGASGSGGKKGRGGGIRGRAQ